MKHQSNANVLLIANQFFNFSTNKYENFIVTKECLAKHLDIVHKKLILKNLLEIQPSIRDPWMIESIVKLTKNLLFFQKYENQHYECSRVLRCLEENEHKEIVTYNSPSEKFFIVLEGQAIVFLKKTPEELEIDRQKFIKNQYNKKLQEDADLLSHNHYMKGITKFKKIKSIKEGDSFGELGILYEKPRMALVVAKTRIQLGILSKHQYLRIFSDNERKQRKNKKEFINNNLLMELKELKYQICQAILYSFKEINLRINEILFKQGTPFSGIYLIKDGQIILSCSQQKRLIPMIRVGSGYLLCYNELKKLMNSQIRINMESTAQAATERCTIYKFDYQEMIKMFDLKILIKSIVQNFSYMEHRVKREEPNKLLLRIRDMSQRNSMLLPEKSQSHQQTKVFECVPFFSRDEIKKSKKSKMLTRNNNHFKKKQTFESANVSIQSQKKLHHRKNNMSTANNSKQQIKTNNNGNKMLLVNSLRILPRKK